MTKERLLNTKDFVFDLQRFATFTNAESDKVVTGTADADTITNNGSNVTISAGGG